MKWWQVTFRLVRFPNWHECQLGERMPWERGILLRRFLALKKWLAPPHVSYIIGFCTTWGSPRHPHHLRKSFQVVARADLAAPPVCPLFQNTIFQLDFSQFAVIFAARSQYKYSWKAALSTANFWETKKVTAREKNQADSVPMSFCSTNRN